jgi:transposase
VTTARGDFQGKTVVACVLLTAEDGTVQRLVRTFSTMTADLLALVDWLDQLEVTHSAMESTGVFWWPLFNVLEDDSRTIIVVNPQHMKQIPGHKTDVKDAEWIADLLRHGLLRASFLPPAPIRALRELVRYRKTLVQQRTQEVNRLHKCWKLPTSSSLPLPPMSWACVGEIGGGHYRGRR